MIDGWLETEARAKVNLLLRIFPRGSDGFHPLQTVFCRIEFADRVRLAVRDEVGVRITVAGHEQVPAGPENLAARAAARFLERAELSLGVDIELQKRIPPGSGLGGGSSDAAAVLRLLSRALDTPLPSDELQSLAARLGADVMFFLADVPLALGWGRGERLGAHPGLDPLPMLLALPDVHVSTAQAYALWDEQAGSSGRRSPAEAGELDDSGLTSWSELARHACNDFESVVFEQLPVLRTLKQRFGETQPLLAQLSGSGSALFAVYETARQRDQAAPHIRQGVEGIRLVSARGPW